jgi:hypothetical protein
MGLVVDLPGSSFSFNNPKQDDVFGAVLNMFVCVMHEFEIVFGLGFDPDPRKGVGGSPAQPESWDIGIVQNVIFERMNFVYDNGTTFTADFPNPVLDSVATLNPPFYDDPVIVPACKLDPMLPCTKYVSVSEPVLNVFYTSRGYGELLAPTSVDPTGVAVTNSPNSVNMLDEPSFGARKMLKNGAWITDAEHIIAFQTWLVAKTPSKVHLLAYVGPFSLVFWMSAQPSPDLLSIGAPPNQFGFYGTDGIVKKVNRSSSSSATIAMHSGAGGKGPVLVGPTANERGRNWLRTNNLLPS